jgi:hypothetical protein
VPHWPNQLIPRAGSATSTIAYCVPAAIEIGLENTTATVPTALPVIVSLVRAEAPDGTPPLVAQIATVKSPATAGATTSGVLNPIWTVTASSVPVIPAVNVWA